MRFYSLSKNLPVTLFLLLLTTVHVACHWAASGIWFSRQVSPYQLVGRSPHLPPHMTGWSLGVAVDILVAMGIVWQLLKFNFIFRSTGGVVRKFLLTAVITGGFTAICGIVLLILMSKTKYAFVVLAVNFAKIYAITVFSNLAMVQGLQRQSKATEVTLTRNLGSTIRSYFYTSFYTTTTKDESSLECERVTR